MKRFRKYFLAWAPPIIWMGTIFFFSMRQHFAITDQSVVDFFIFKLLHMLEYAGLFILLTRAFYMSNYPIQKAIFYAFIIGILYAATDELHQLFVPTREGRFRDIVIDTTGISFIFFIFQKYARILKKIFFI